MLHVLDLSLSSVPQNQASKRKAPASRVLIIRTVSCLSTLTKYYGKGAHLASPNVKASAPATSPLKSYMYTNILIIT